MVDISCTPCTFQLEMSPSNDLDNENIVFMSVTLDTSHFEMSVLNELAKENMVFMSVTFDTSQVEMAPYVTVAELESSHHLLRAASNSDRRENVYARARRT